MTPTLAIDVYGTLIDPFGVASKLAELTGPTAPTFARLWREKQLEYLFRRALGRDYRPFPVCTAEALEYTCNVLGVALSHDEKLDLLALYRELPAYDGVREALLLFKNAGCRSFAFSNGEPGDLRHLLEHADLSSVLDGIVSVHAVKSYKPDPAVYAHFLQQAGSAATNTWLVSGNSFDVVGAHHAGWSTAWLRRTPDVEFDPWGIEPTVTIAELVDLADIFS